MLRTCRILALVVALTFGSVSGWLTAQAGGTRERALTAIATMLVALGVAALTVGLILGLINDKIGATVAFALTLIADEVGGLIGSPFHSLAGDILVTLCAAIPTVPAVLLGFALGQWISRRKAYGS